MNISPNLNNNTYRNDKKEVPQHILNRKADKKLDYITDLYTMAFDDRYISVDSKLLKRTIYFKKNYHLDYLDLKYNYENRLWSFSYNLDYETTIKSDSKPDIPIFYKFVVKNKGKMGAVKAQWIDSGSKCSEEKIKMFLDRLNHPLITDRIISMDMVNVVAVYDISMNRWVIRCRTLIGSTTWILIPPVMHLIKPKPVECVKVIEFFELVADALLDEGYSG